MAREGRRSAGGRRVLVRFEGVSKRFGSVLAVDRLSLDIHQGEFFALLGPSGCGKTTLLRMLAGFETPDEGRILLDGKDNAAVPPHRRPVNMMFQNYALFPHLTVEGNIAFGLKQESLGPADIATRVFDILKLVKLEGFEKRRVDQLSGGQRQRVALARSLVKRPRVLLLDEPLAALDRKLREETQFELMELQRNLDTTFVIVTHDQEEAMTVAGRIGVMNRGKLVQVGEPDAIYERPKSRWVADFIGDVTLIEGRLAKGGKAIESKIGVLKIASGAGARPGDTVWLALRPETIALSVRRPAGKLNAVTGQVWDVGYRGDTSIYQVRLEDGSLMKVAVANAAHAANPAAKSGKVWLSWPPQAGVVLTS